MNMSDEQIKSRLNEMRSRIIMYHHNRDEFKSDINYIKSFFEFSINHNIENQIDYLTLTIDELRALKKDYNNILTKCKISIFIKHIDDISLPELKEIKKNFNVQYISVKDLYNFDDSYQISVDLIYKYKKAIQKITDGIDDNFLKNQDDREKVIFGILIPRILENTRYDINAQEEYEKKSKLTRFGKIIYDNPSNEILGLIKGKCVCRGYAGIVRDVFRLVGIDVCIIAGVSINVGHAWNQIKLDGEWYNIDVTWDRDFIIKEGKSYWLLKDDYRFEMGYLIQDGSDVKELSHRIYSIDRTPGNICKKSLSSEELSKYLNFSDLRKKNWLASLKKLDLEQIKSSAIKLFSDMNNKNDSNNLRR